MTLWLASVTDSTSPYEGERRGSNPLRATIYSCMEFSFSNWYEMSGHMTSDISNVNLKRDIYGYIYDFDVGGNHYSVGFDGPNPWPDVARNGYTVHFEGPDLYDMPGNTKVPTAVYGEVFKAIRKLMDVAKPEYLSFSGSNPRQDVMYDLFYRKFLSQLFTRIGDAFYLRNDLYEKHEREQGRGWAAIQDEERSNRLEKRLAMGRQEMNASRQQRRQGITSTQTAQNNPRGWNSI